MLHRVAEEVFLRPSTEQPRRVPHSRLAVSRADQARLVTGGGELANLSHPQASAAVADPRAPFGQVQRGRLAVGQRHGCGGEFALRPSRFWILVVGGAGDAVRLPHLPEELRAVAFAVEEDYEAVSIPIGS